MEFIRGNIFNTNDIASQLEISEDKLRLAHCIASDFGMYGGIARKFVENFDMKLRLFEYAISENLKFEWSSVHHSYIKSGNVHEMGTTRCYPSLIGKAVKIDNVYNLVTKKLTSELPTLRNLDDALTDVREQMLKLEESTLLIPDMLGCGIDKLERFSVIADIDSIFQLTNIRVIAVKL